MSKNAATEEKLGQLHSLIADTLINELSNIPEDEPLDPRLISSAISFLRDNKIQANPFLEEKMSEIEERLSARTRKFKVVPSEAAKRAAGE